MAFLPNCTYFTSCTIRMNLYKWPTPNPAPRPTSHWGLDKSYKIVYIKNKAPPTEPAPRPPWLCTETVQGGSLDGIHICAGPGVSYVPDHSCQVFPRSGNKTAGSERFLERQQVYLSGFEMSPNQLNHLGSAARDSLWNAQLTRPRTWMAQSNLRCFRLQRRRWWVSCD